MVLEMVRPECDVPLSLTLRSLARDARAAMSRPVPDPQELRDLLRRVRRLREAFGNRRDAPILGWLDSLRRDLLRY